MNILENFLFGSNIKDSVNKNTYDEKVLINENNALKIQIYLLNNELDIAKHNNELLKTTNKKIKKLSVITSECA